MQPWPVKIPPQRCVECFERVARLCKLWMWLMYNSFVVFMLVFHSWCCWCGRHSWLIVISFAYVTNLASYCMLLLMWFRNYCWNMHLRFWNCRQIPKVLEAIVMLIQTEGSVSAFMLCVLCELSVVSKLLRVRTIYTVNHKKVAVHFWA